MRIHEKILVLDTRPSTKEEIHDIAEVALIDLLYEVVYKFEYARAAISIYRDTYGKPCVNVCGVNRKTAVSISHTDSCVFVAASDDVLSLGVDVEHIRAMSDTLRNGMLSENEKKALSEQGLEKDVSCHTKIWCMKESIVKALGTGFRTHPQSIDISQLLMVDEGAEGIFYQEGVATSCHIFCNRERDGYFFYGLYILHHT